MVLSKYEKGYKFIKCPSYPDVPYAEYVARYTKAQELMAQKGVDCLVLWNRKNIRYYFGFQTTHFSIPSLQCAVGIIPDKGEPILILPDFFTGTAETLCWNRNMYYFMNAHQPKVERELPVYIAELIKELGYGGKNIGMEKGPLGCMSIPRPLNDIEAFIAALPDANLVDGDGVIWGCRMIKSSLEVDRISASAAYTAAIASTLVEDYRPGMTETDISSIIHSKAASFGTTHLGDSVGLQGSFRAALNKEICADLGPSEGAPIVKGDYIFYDVYYDYKGYVPDTARMFQVSEVTDEIKRMYDLVYSCEDAVEAALKPGVRANEIWQIMYDPIKRAGLPVLDMGGHGTGLDTHEPPSIDAWNEWILEEGMVLSIEPWVYEDLKINGGTGKFGVQDQFLITKDGCQKLPGYNRDIIQVSHPIL